MRNVARRATRIHGWRLAGLFVTLVALTVPAFGQPAADAESTVSRVESAYEALDYAGAESLARQALSQPSAFSGAQLVRLHTALALILYARNDALGAAQQFRAALTLDQGLRLDPVLVSPVTLAFFEETRQAFLEERRTDARPTSAVSYVVVRDERPAAALRSLVLPGWGQRARGERARGWVMTAAWAATLGGGVAAHFQRANARDAYLAETDPDLVDDRYDTYNMWHRARGALFLGAGVVWAGAVIDALARGAPVAPQTTRLTVAPAGAGLRMVMALP